MIEARSETSTAWLKVLRPIPSICRQFASSNSVRLPPGTTLAPCSASPIAILCPSPDVPPKTTATRPVKSRQLLPTVLLIELSQDEVIAGPRFQRLSATYADGRPIPGVCRIYAEAYRPFLSMAQV